MKKNSLFPLKNATSPKGAIPTDVGAIQEGWNAARRQIEEVEGVERVAGKYNRIWNLDTATPKLIQERDKHFQAMDDFFERCKADSTSPETPFRDAIPLSLDVRCEMIDGLQKVMAVIESVLEGGDEIEINELLLFGLISELKDSFLDGCQNTPSEEETAEESKAQKNRFRPDSRVNDLVVRLEVLVWDMNEVLEVAVADLTIADVLATLKLVAAQPPSGEDGAEESLKISAMGPGG